MSSFCSSLCQVFVIVQGGQLLEKPGKWKGVLENLENDSFWSKILEKQGFLKNRPGVFPIR